MSVIESYLSQEELVHRVLTINELRDKTESGNTLNIMMGQTFDGGQPLDVMKYALFMMNLGDILRGEGIQSTARWLIADHFITDINQDVEAVKVKDQLSNRVAYLQLINRVYGGNIGFVFSSGLSQTEEYKQNLEVLFEEASHNEDFRHKILEAVPQDRRSNPNALSYPFEELATIQSMDTDIKVGPPYEVYYDEPAREIAQVVGFNRYVAIHLTRAFPFGNPTISPSTAEEIEAFGLLPYKKGSKGLDNHRIEPVSDSLDRVQELIATTTDRRAITDLIVVGQQAYQRLEGRQHSSVKVEKLSEKSYNASANQQSRELQELALDLYVRYIHNPVNLT